MTFAAGVAGGLVVGFMVGAVAMGVATITLVAVCRRIADADKAWQDRADGAELVAEVEAYIREHTA